MSNNQLIQVEQISKQLYGPDNNAEILKFCQQVQDHYKENTHKFEELFQALITTNNLHFKFWILDSLSQIVLNKYNSMSKETRDKFRQALLNMFNYEKIFKESFIVNKYCTLFNNFIYYDFPENNNSIFNDILNNIYGTKDDTEKISKLNLLLQIFDIFNEEYIQFRHTYDQQKINRSTKIKDYLRINVIQNILIVVKSILENEEYIKNDKVIKKSMKIVSQFIDWIPFEYFIDVLKVILGDLIKKYKYFDQCCDIIYAIIKKGMEPKMKRTILNDINPMINNFLKSNKRIGEYTLQKISEINNLIGNFIIENFEHTKDLIKKNGAINDDINESFNWSCNELRYYFYFIKEIFIYGNEINYKCALTLCESLEDIILYLKSNDIIITKNHFIIDSFKEVFEVFPKILKIPSDEFSLDEDLNKYNEEESIFLLRKEFGIIYRNCYNINILREYTIDLILNNLTNLLNIKDGQNNNYNVNSMNKYDIEFCLYLINILFEGFSGNDLNNKKFNINGKLTKIFNILFSFPFTKVENAEYILMSYYDNINRSMGNIIDNPTAIEQIIKLYISEQGIFYYGKDFCKLKIINYFDRFLSKLKPNIGKINLNINYNVLSNAIKEFINKLIKGIQKHKNFQIMKDYNILFHSYGLIISFEKNMENKKKMYEEALKLFNIMPGQLQVFSNNYPVEPICEIILNILTQFIQTITFEIKSDEIKKIFIDFFNNFIGSYCIKIINNKNTSLLSRYISFMQRLLILLGNDSSKYLEYFFNNNFLNPNTISDCLKLLQNCVNYLKKGAIFLIKKTFNSFYILISGFPLPKDNISEENKIIINIYMEFVKTFSNICQEIPEAFFENNGIDNLNFVNLMKFLINIGSNFIESAQRKTTIKSIRFLCSFFNKNKNVFQQQSNFGDIISLILNGLFFIYSKCNNKKDANDLISVVEIAHCHLFLIEFNEKYNIYLSGYLNQNEINQFVNIIKGNDYKKIKPSEQLLSAIDGVSKKVLNNIK